MLQRQIMFKQLQELQRNQQQLQELADSRNQEYLNQLASLKQASGVQFAPPINGEPIRDSHMLALGNMQMMQHGGSNVYQGYPNGFIGSQGQSHGLSLSTPQFDVSAYGSLNANSDKNLNLYSQLQGLSTQSDNMLVKNNNRILGMSTMHQSGFPGAFDNQQPNFTDGALIPNEMYHENNVFGQVPVQSLNADLLSGNYTNQRIRMQSPEDNSWSGVSSLKTSNVALREDDNSLDPLERKILYGTDDDSFGFLFGGSQIDKGGFKGKADTASYTDKSPSMRIGSWSALMQSAVAETSSSENGIQEEWSGLGFHNQEQSPENVPASIMSNEKLQNNWVDRSMQNVSSPSPELQKADMNYGFPDFQLSSHSYPKHEGEFQPNNNAQFLSKQSQHKIAPSGSQLFQSIPPSNALSSQRDEKRDTLWLSRSPSSTSGVMQNAFDQVNQLNVNRFSTGDSSTNDEPVRTNFLTSSVSHGQNMTSQSKKAVDIFNKDSISADEMQLNSRVPFSFMGNSCVSSIQSPQNQVTAKFPGYGSGTSQAFGSQHVGTSAGQPTNIWSQIAAQQHPSSPKSHKFPSNLLRSSDSFSSRMETNSAAMDENLQEKESSLNSIKMHHLIPLSSSLSQHPSRQDNKRDAELPVISAGDVKNSGCQTLKSNSPVLHQVHSPRSTEFDFGNKLAANDVANGKELFLNRQKAAVEEKAKLDAEHHAIRPLPDSQEEKASATADNQNAQPSEMLRHAETGSHSVGANEITNGAYPSQISLQMAPSWFKHYGSHYGILNNNNNQMHPPKTSAQPFFRLNTGTSQEHDGILLGHPAAIANQGSAVSSPSSSPVLFSGGQVQNKLLLPVDAAANQNSDVSMKKKRKVITSEPVPWHKEVNHQEPGLQDISMGDLEWAQVSNCKPEEASFEVDIIDELPMNRAKRRLVFTTLLMQQVLRPAPAVILSRDANSVCDSVAYFASRVALGDACNLMSITKSDTDAASKDKLEAQKRTSKSEFSKIADGLISRVKKLEADLSSSLDKALLMADVKVDNQEMEKFSVINRFAKFHMKAQSSGDQASCSGPSKTHPERYVSAYPILEPVPEVLDCVSL